MDIVNPEASKIILGSYPGKLSNGIGEYYSHPTNKIWELLNIPVKDENGNMLSYSEKVKALKAKDIGLWDVVNFCERFDNKGNETSADKDIKNQEYNDFSILQDKELYFNGMLAWLLFKKEVEDKHLPFDLNKLKNNILPSSSGAYARDHKKREDAWSAIFN